MLVLVLAKGDGRTAAAAAGGVLAAGSVLVLVLVLAKGDRGAGVARR